MVTPAKNKHISMGASQQFCNIHAHTQLCMPIPSQLPHHPPKGYCSWQRAHHTVCQSYCRMINVAGNTLAQCPGRFSESLIPANIFIFLLIFHRVRIHELDLVQRSFMNYAPESMSFYFSHILLCLTATVGISVH